MKLKLKELKYGNTINRDIANKFGVPSSTLTTIKRKSNSIFLNNILLWTRKGKEILNMPLLMYMCYNDLRYIELIYSI